MPLFAEALGPLVRYLVMPFFAVLGLVFIAAAVSTFATGKSGANVKERVLYGHKEYSGPVAYFRAICFLLFGVVLVWFGVASLFKGYNAMSGP